MNRCRITLIVFSAVLCCSLALFGQTQKARLTGTVSDTSGAVIPDAQVTATNTDTGIKREVTTNQYGLYTIPLLDPGSYELLVQKEGFRSTTRSGITLHVSDTVRVDFVLEVGAVTESVVVEAAVPLLQTSKASQGEVIDNVQVTNLPLNGRSAFRLAQLTPGFIGTRGAQGQFGDVPVNTTWDANFSINGGQGTSNEIHIDGTPSTAGYFNQITTMPSVDALQEFKVLTNSMSAEYGRLGGGVLNVSTKSGTNEYHGTLFEFLRNDVFDANEYFNKRAGRDIPAFRMNQYGGSFGGPVQLPKLYNGKERTFFFFNYEATRWRRGDVFTTNVPTMLQRQGDFSQTLNNKGQLVVVYDPLSTRPDPSHPGRFIRDAFAGNILPPDRIDPVSKNIAGYYPEPNTPGVQYTNASNYISNKPRKINKDQYNFRLDHNITDMNRIFGRYSQDDTDLCQPDRFGNVASPGLGNIGCTSWFNKSATLQDMHTFNPTTIFDIRYGFARWYQTRKSRSYGFDNSKLGLPAELVAEMQVPMFPNVSVQGYSSLGPFNNMFFVNGNDTHSLLASVTKVMGRHVIKTGTDLRIARINNLQASRPNGQYSFTRRFTQGPDPLKGSAVAGDGFATMLLGALNSGGINKMSGVAMQNYYFAAFVQDDFQVSTRLTLNLGLRYETESPYTERYDALANFDYDAPSPVANPYFPNLTGALFYANAGSNHSRHVTRWEKVNFAPRAGIAYRLTDKTVIRAGAGLFYAPLQISNNAVAFQPDYGYQATTAIIGSIDGNLTPYTYMSNPFPDGVNQPTGKSLGARTYLGQGFAVWDKELNQPYSGQWNFSIQRQLPSGIAVDLAYTGTSGVHLARSRQLNALPTQFLSMKSDLLKTVDNPFYGLIDTGVMSKPKVTVSRLLRPFPQYEGINILNSTSGHSSYHAFQAKVERRLTTGLSFLLAYTAGKLISDAPWATTGIGPDNGSGGFQDWYNLRAERSLSAQDVSQSFVLNGTYELPFGPGRAIGSGTSGFLGKLIGGWQLNGILTLTTGNPLTVTTQTNNTNSLGGGSRPNSTGQSAAFEGNRSRDEQINQWFNTEVFTLPDSFTFGNVARTLPDAREPGVKNLDISVFKNTKIGERVNLQFRAEFFNAFNHVNFAAPNTSMGSKNFGRITGTAKLPRVGQLALKLTF